MAARELRLSLEEALQLVLLYAAYEPAKVERAAVRWLARYVDECAPTLLQVQISVAALSGLRRGDETAANLLREMCNGERERGLRAAPFHQDETRYTQNQ